MNNLSPLFHTTSGSVCYLNTISLTEETRTLLREERDRVRVVIRDRLPGALKKRLNGNAPIRQPRFWGQGSWSYRTLNDPAHKPPQQVDIDDGTYLPMSLAKNEGPRQASKLFIEALEEVLAAYANLRGFKIDTSKATCTRLIIRHDIHIDIPLYVIPDEEMDLLEKAALSFGFRNFSEALSKSDQMDQLLLAERRIYLAHKTLGWKPSDPRAITRWFQDEVRARGEQLRRVIRYLKGWRDHQQWLFREPTSILLMVATAGCFEEHSGRDDTALLQVVEKLPEILQGAVYNPAEKTFAEDLNAGFDHRARAEITQKLHSLAQSLNSAISGSLDPTNACLHLQTHLGQRFPNAPERIRIETTASVSLSCSSTVQARPYHGTTRSA